jgi:hypothetical protein
MTPETPSFDKMAAAFTARVRFAAAWAASYPGAAYATRIRAAIADLRTAIAEAEKSPEIGRPVIGADDLPPPHTLIEYEDGSIAALMFHFAAEGHSFGAIAEQAGYRAIFVDLENDRSAEGQALFIENGDGGNVLDRWRPKPPEGWMLGAIFDSEEGPCACFIRPVGNQTAAP